MEIKNYSVGNYCGYQLRACDEFWSLTPVQVAEIAHGCGPGKGWKESIIPDFIFGVSLTPACIIHDVEFHFGETLDDMKEANQNFIHNMLEINSQDSRFWLAKIIRRQLIFLYYSATEDLGRFTFQGIKEHKKRSLG